MHSILLSPMAVRPSFTNLLLVTLLAALPSSAEDWPQWRGPRRDGLSSETGLLTEWPASGPPQVWKTTGLGAGYSGVSIAGGRIFTMGDGADSSFVYALEEPSGKTLWSAKVGKPGGGGGYPGPRCTPTVSDGLVFALGQHGDLVCLEVATGKEIWRKNLAKDFGGKVGGWGYSESPLIDGDRLVCTPGGSQGTIVAFDKKTGVQKWRAKDLKDRAEYASIIPVEISGVRQYVQLTGDSVSGVDAADGWLLWRAERKGRTAVIPTPIFFENQVYVTSGYGVGCNLFRVKAAGGQLRADPVYENKVMVNHHGGVVLVGDHLYGYSDGKGWVCQGFKTGNALWEEKGRLGKGALAYADGHLYLRGESKGTMVLIEASPAGYNEKGRFEQPERSDQRAWPHPVLANGKLYLRDQDKLFCYDVKKKERSSGSLPGEAR